jgi:hypothetical protein
MPLLARDLCVIKLFDGKKTCQLVRGIPSNKLRAS